MKIDDTRLLGGLTPAQFLQEYWQKKPLLIRQAIPGFQGLIEHQELFELACDPDVESRLVRQKSGQWEVLRGPQKATNLRPRKQPWTVLVQGLNLWLDEADALLQRFNFIPQARLDDLMVSYAVDGGGVGPHFDNYDVFLLQGCGQRRWQISSQQDRTLIDDAPLKILRNFAPEHDWVLDPGDMLYLPPHWAHNGVAIGECTTYSIGFKSPDALELGCGFLGWLQDRMELEGLYADPDLKLQEHSAEISPAMVTQVSQMLSQIRWDHSDVAMFLGEYLTEPKPHVFFDPPEDPLSLAQFARAFKQQGVRLNRRSLMLFTEGCVFLNGEPFPEEDFPAEHLHYLIALADQRCLPAGANYPQVLIEVLYEAYLNDFIWLTLSE
jgi:50S ribosomal protein L16 3-hydroxylase